MPPRAATILALALLLTAGCLGTDEASPSASNASAEAEAIDPAGSASADEDEASQREQTGEADEADGDPREAVTLTEEGRVEVEVPVDVVLVGVPASVGEEVDGELDRLRVDHAKTVLPRQFPPDPLPNDHGYMEHHPNGIVPIANVTVHEAPPAFEQRFRGMLANNTVAEAGPVYDGNAAEAWLAANLVALGIDPADNPVVTLLHTEIDGHAYRYGYAEGYLEPVRAFGGQHPLLALDVSARADPWVENASTFFEDTPFEQDDSKPWDEPLEAESAETGRVLADAARAAIEYRLLQGPLYEPTTKPCYGVTLLVGIERTAFSQHAPGVPAPEDVVDEARIRAGLEQVTGTHEVHVDLETRYLPDEDPGLFAVANTQDPDTVRWWLAENWSDYWIAHEACEPIVSFLLFADGSNYGGGRAFHGGEDSYRVSLSVVEPFGRVRGGYTGPGREHVAPREDGEPAYEHGSRLLTHETGHLLGLRHPHDVWRTEEGGAATYTFSSTETVMSYQTGDRTMGFGHDDRANYLRNRAGELVQEALEDGLEDRAAFEQALVDLGQRDWAGANERLTELLAEG